MTACLSRSVVVAGLVLCAVVGTWLHDGVAGNARLATASTVFCAVLVQAAPFLVLVSGFIAAYVSAERLAR